MPRENSLTYDDFAEHKIVLISDEAHHINSSTKKGGGVQTGELPGMDDSDISKSWETTVMRIFRSNDDNVLLEFTATADFTDANIVEKYANKVIFDYPLKKFREDGFSKDIAVIQSDLSPIDRAVQGVLLSQYKRKLFAGIRQDIKPVMMLKSKTIAENKNFYREFVDKIKDLSADDLLRIRSSAKDDILAVFTYLDEQHIGIEEFLLEIKEDFKEENLLLVDGENISPEKQIELNTLESEENEYRVVFAVNMLNEGWDVLNLFDIVRMYETRDTKNGKPGKTTVQEAQLIGRGARYMPFEDPAGRCPRGARKYDRDFSNRLRALETLHYHSVSNPKYISELRTAMVSSGIVGDNARTISLRLKESFKRSSLYRHGVVFANERLPRMTGGEAQSLAAEIREYNYRAVIRTGEMATSHVFESESTVNTSPASTRSITLGDLGYHVVRAAVNRVETFRFGKLRTLFPGLRSVKEFIEDYLGDINIVVHGSAAVIENLPARERLNCALAVLRQVEAIMKKSFVEYRGSERFMPYPVKNVFRDHFSMKISVDDSSNREYGRSMKESVDESLRMDIGLADWYAYDDCYGTREEKCFVKYIESVYRRLKDKYSEIWLIRNEGDLRIYDFETGRVFEPDYVLSLVADGGGGRSGCIQIFAEPKGAHLRSADKWKENFMLEIRNRADLRFSTDSMDFNILGLPFFTEELRYAFNAAFDEAVLSR